MTEKQIKAQYLSLFYKTVVKPNYGELEQISKADIDSKKIRPEKIAQSTYNFISSAIAWKKKAQKLCEEEDITTDDDFIEEKIIEKTGERRMYFLQGLRGYYNHTGEFLTFKLSQIPDIPQSKLSLKPSNIEKLKADLKKQSKKGKKEEKAYNYLKDNEYDLDLIEEFESLNKGLYETNKWVQTELKKKLAN